MMDINGCHIVGAANADGIEGFSLMVSRYSGCRKLFPSPPPDAVKTTKGPFFSVHAAIAYAKTWDDADSPPVIPPHDPMMINGCSITAIANDSAPDGYVSSVSREVMELGSTGIAPAGSPEGTIPSEPTITTIVKGPFESLVQAIAYAKSWIDIENPPATQAATEKISPATETVANEKNEQESLPTK